MAGRHGTSDGFMYQRDMEMMSRDQLAAVQLQRLQWSVRHAWENVGAYRRRFAEAGVMPEDLGSLDDLRHLPFTEKSDLRDHYPFGMFAVPREDLIRVHASSGTTGKSTVVGYTRDDLETWSTLMARTLACAGARPGQVLHNAFGYGLFTGGLGTHYGAEKLGCRVTPMSGGNTEQQIEVMLDFGARVICSTPSYALNSAERAKELGVDFADTPLSVGFFGAEPWTEAMRDTLQDSLGITAMDKYGLSEILGPGVAVECPDGHSGLHVWGDHFIVEIIDPETERPVEPGEPGELVITTLSKQALPMLRYRTRDITRVMPGACPCARTHLRIQRMTGRIDDMLIIRGVNVFPSQVEANLVGVDGLAPFFQLVIRRQGHMDDLTVEAEAMPDTPESAYAELAVIVQRQLKSMVGVSSRVEIRHPGALPRSQGKAVRVRDLRDTAVQ